MSYTTISIHMLNGLIGCLCIAVLALTARSVVLKDQLENEAPSNLKSTGLSLLFWPGVGGVVDMVLFLLLWINTPFNSPVSIFKHTNQLLDVGQTLTPGRARRGPSTSTASSS
jgi:hypothetical protein